MDFDDVKQQMVVTWYKGNTHISEFTFIYEEQLEYIQRTYKLCSFKSVTNVSLDFMDEVLHCFGENMMKFDNGLTGGRFYVTTITYDQGDTTSGIVSCETKEAKDREDFLH